MRKMGLINCLSLAASLFLGPLSASDTTSQIDEIFEKWDRTNSPGCSMGVFRDGDIEYARGYGLANLDYGIALTPRTVFRIGSTAKQFTAMCIDLLAEDGKLSLDDDIRKYLPELPRYDHPVTIRQMLHHTSGLRDYLNLHHLAQSGENYNNQDVLDMLARQKALNFKPGDEHLYSNSGYFLLSEIVKRASGKSLREYAEEHIFIPLEMKNTHFHDDHTEVVANRAYGYVRADHTFEVSMTTLDMVGDGGVFTTIEDLLRWDRNFYDNKLGKQNASLIETALTPGVLNSGKKLEYALGLTVSDYRGQQMVSHGGAFVGFRAELVRLPRQNLSVAVLCNLGQTNPSALARKVVDVLLADQLDPVPEKAVTKATTQSIQEVSSKVLARYVGSYWLEFGALAKIDLVSQALTLQVGGEPVTELLPLSESTFALKDEQDTALSFEQDESKETFRLVVRTPGREFSGERLAGAPPSEEELKRYTGAYYSEELEVTYQILMEDGGLVIPWPKRTPVKLQMPVGGTFYGSGFHGDFETGSDGIVTGFVLEAGRARGIQFKKVG
jgi:CubicO group peptidase (beta-lactamase class C family)